MWFIVPINSHLSTHCTTIVVIIPIWKIIYLYHSFECELLNKLEQFQCFQLVLFLWFIIYYFWYICLLHIWYQWSNYSSSFEWNYHTWIEIFIKIKMNWVRNGKIDHSFDKFCFKILIRVFMWKTSFFPRFGYNFSTKKWFAKF